MEHSEALQKCAAERDDAKLALKDSTTALGKEKLLSETSLQRFKLAMIKRLSTKTWKRSTVKWTVATLAGNVVLATLILNKVSTHLPEKTLTRLRAVLNWLTTLTIRGGTALSRVLLGLTVSILIRIQTAVAPSALFMHTNHMIVRSQPDIGSSAILVDGGGTDFMTNSLEGIIDNLARVKGESFIIVAGPKALEDCGLFRKTVYGKNGNSVEVQTRMWYDPTLNFDIYGLPALRKLLGAVYIDADDPVKPTTSAILRLTFAENLELELGRTNNGLEWLNYDAPKLITTSISRNIETLAYPLQLSPTAGIGALSMNTTTLESFTLGNTRRDQIVHMESFSTQCWKEKTACYLTTLQQTRFIPPGQQAFLNDLERRWSPMVSRVLSALRQPGTDRIHWLTAIRDTLDKEYALAGHLRPSSPDHGYQRTLRVDVPDVISFYAPDRFILDKAELASDIFTGLEYLRSQSVLPYGHVIPPAPLDFEIQLGRASLPPSWLSITTPGSRLLLLSPTATKEIEIDDSTCGGDICPWISYGIQVTANGDSHPELKIHGTDLGSGGTLLGHESWGIFFDGRTHFATLAAPVVLIPALPTDDVFATLTWRFYSDSKPTLATLTASIIPHILLVMTDPRHGQRIICDCSDGIIRTRTNKTLAFGKVESGRFPGDIRTRTNTTLAFGKVESGRRFPGDMKELAQHSMRLHYTSLRLRGGAPPLSIITIFLVGPDYDRSGSARLVLPRHATLRRLTSVVYVTTPKLNGRI